MADKPSVNEARMPPMNAISAVALRLLCPLLFLAFLPFGCTSQDLKPADFSGRIPVVRVLILQNQSSVQLTASEPPIMSTAGVPRQHRLDVPRGTAVPLSLTTVGWRVGNIIVGTGEMQLQPASEGSVAFDGHAYRGRFRLVPTGPERFDVVNDVDVDGYLKGVIPKELKRFWADETYKAQAVVARTYAIYELKAASSGSHYDLFSDQRSQVYGGLSAETSQARNAVDETSGIVVTAGPPGQERIFKAYFSSCCGGIGQSAADAFGDPPGEALSEQSVGTLCSESPHFSWPTVIVSKADLTKRFRHFGQTRNRPEKDMAYLSRIDVAAKNRYGRPVRFVVSDVRGAKFYWTGEEIRWAVNTDSTETTKLMSSLFDIDNSQQGVIRFTNGRGWGHGVGMCQWCAQRRAEMGMKYDAIVTTAFPGSKLLRAY
jgi:stage II sporulation protein D